MTAPQNLTEREADLYQRLSDAREALREARNTIVAALQQPGAEHRREHRIGILDRIDRAIITTPAPTTGNICRECGNVRDRIPCPTCAENDAAEARIRGTPAAHPDPDLSLLAKFATGEGGRRTGELMRRGLIRVEVTDAGRKALGMDVTGEAVELDSPNFAPPALQELAERGYERVNRNALDHIQAARDAAYADVAAIVERMKRSAAQFADNDEFSEHAVSVCRIIAADIEVARAKGGAR